jgi:hypothetical protein
MAVEALASAEAGVLVDRKVTGFLEFPGVCRMRGSMALSVVFYRVSTVFYGL